jgi:hypothetical protein
VFCARVVENKSSGGGGREIKRAEVSVAIGSERGVVGSVAILVDTIDRYRLLRNTTVNYHDIYHCSNMYNPLAHSQ